MEQHYQIESDKKVSTRLRIVDRRGEVVAIETSYEQAEYVCNTLNRARGQR